VPGGGIEGGEQVALHSDGEYLFLLFSTTRVLFVGGGSNIGVWLRASRDRPSSMQPTGVVANGGAGGWLFIIPWTMLGIFCIAFVSKISLLVLRTLFEPMRSSFLGNHSAISHSRRHVSARESTKHTPSLLMKLSYTASYHCFHFYGRGRRRRCASVQTITPLVWLGSE